MKFIVGIMGPGKDASVEEVNLGYEIGKIVGKTEAVLLSGGMKTGVMESSCRGAHEVGGTVLGISPGDDKKGFNDFVDFPVVTSMKSGRNYINVLSSDLVIAIGVNSPGTLSEVAFALALGKPLVVVGSDKNTKEYLSKVGAVNGSPLHFMETSEEVKKLVSTYMADERVK